MYILHPLSAAQHQISEPALCVWSEKFALEENSDTLGNTFIEVRVNSVDMNVVLSLA